MKQLKLLIFVVLLLTSVSTSQATLTQSFKIFTTDGTYYNDSRVNLYVDIFDSGGQAVFEFHNESLIATSIEGVYFEDGSLLELDHIVNFVIDLGDKIGTKFSQGASPPNLSAGNTLLPSFKTTEGFLADSDPPTSKWGINPGEKLQLVFNLKSNKSLDNVAEELADGSLRIGMHVIAFPDGSSNSAINIPEPATICLLGLGVLGLLKKRRA
ncbi:MAG: PEP-CTERM sorting domain-containing protein [Planctomycetota bacterium]|nr:PEP-CTERM sorting domain-containing protein [Planctomycetota bacterium]